MSSRVSPTDRIRGQIDALFAQDGSLPEIIEEVARLGAQLIIQTAVEAEVTEFLGRRPLRARRGQRASRRDAQRLPAADRDQDHRRAGERARPKLRGTQRGVRVSAVRRQGVTKSNALECLVIASFVRGLSVRDVEATLADALGVDGRDQQVGGVADLPADRRRVERWNRRPPR